jgi:hypothetical protein
MMMQAVAVPKTTIDFVSIQAGLNGLGIGNGSALE